MDISGKKNFPFYNTHERCRIIVNSYQHIYTSLAKSDSRWKQRQVKHQKASLDNFDTSLRMEYLLWIKIRLLNVLFQSFLNDLLFHLELFQVFFRDNGWCPLHSPFTLFSPSIEIFALIYYITLVTRGITCLDNQSEKLVDAIKSTCL